MTGGWHDDAGISGLCVCPCAFVLLMPLNRRYRLSDDFSFSRKNVWYLIILKERKSARAHSHSFLTSNQIHVYKIWFDMSSLLRLIPQALQGETERHSQCQREELRAR